MTINHPLTDVGSHRADQSGARRVTNPPNMERQVHKACGDINAALNEALEALGRLSHSPVDAFGVARVQTALYGKPITFSGKWSERRSSGVCHGRTTVHAYKTRRCGISRYTQTAVGKQPKDTDPDPIAQSGVSRS